MNAPVPDEPNVRPRPDGPFKRHFHAARSRDAVVVLRRPCFPYDASVGRLGAASAVGREGQPAQECRNGDKREVSRAGSGHFSALGFTGLRKRGCVGLTLAEGRMCLCGARRRANRTALLRLDRTGSALSDRLVGREHSVGRGRLRILGRGMGRKQFSLERSVGRQAPSGQELLGSAVVREPCQVMLDGFAIRAAGPGMAPVVPPLPGGRSSAPMVGRRGCSSS
jgi:hypothetical protein